VRRSTVALYNSVRCSIVALYTYRTHGHIVRRLIALYSVRRSIALYNSVRCSIVALYTHRIHGHIMRRSIAV
jgi:hypothetical protein